VFTDFNLQGKPIRIWHRGELLPTGMPVLGGCVGHNVKIGSGFVIYPARSIESGCVLPVPEDTNVITHNLSYEESQKRDWRRRHRSLAPGEAIAEEW